MKKQMFISVLFLLLFSAFNLKAQDSTLIKIDKHFALQFQANGLFDFTNFNNYGFAGKYHSGNFAVRLGFEINRKDTDEDYKYEKQDTLFGKKSFEEINSGLGFFAEGLYYFNLFDHFAAYTGAGLFARFEKIKYGYPSAYDVLLEDRYENESKEYGVNLLIGTEWFVRNNIGLSLEYGIRIAKTSESYMSYDEYQESNGTILKYRREIETKGFSIYQSSVKLGVAVYF